jgi:type I restriction-modification system DNA methylase subunit
MTEVSYKGLLSLKEEKLIAGAFKLLWRSLQSSEVSKFFEGRDFGMFSIEKNEKKADKYFKLLKEIVQYFASIEIASYDSNAGYTYFKKDLNRGTAQTFGQFYTPPSVLSSVVKEVNPKAGEKTLDPSSGSCSFIQEAATKLMKIDGLSVEDAFQNLYGVEIEPNIYQEGAMNIFLNFGIIPNTEENIREDDSLIVLLQEEQKFDKILANPPFGADAASFFGMYFKDETVKKGKRTITIKVVNPGVKVQIPFTNTKESAILFFQLIAQKLVDGGKAGVVMSSTLLNDGNKDMMKWFLECCSLEKVVINPAGTFKDQGTGIETFSFIFTKGAPTTKVNIVMLGAEDHVVRSLTIGQIKEAGWKLELKEVEKVKDNDAFSYEEIGNLFNYELGKVAASSAIPGEFRFMTLDDTATHTAWDYEGENIFVSKIPSGTGSTFTPKFRYSNTRVSASSLMLRLVPKSDKISLKFFYYFWKLKPLEYLRSFYKGAANKSIDQDKFSSFRFPLPPLPIQQEIVQALDLIYNNATAAKATAPSIKAQMAAVMRSVGARGYEKKKLGDVYSNPKTMKRFNSGERDNVGEVPFFNGKWSCPDGTHSEHSFESDSPYFVMIKDGGGDHNSETVGMGKFFNISGKCAITSHNMVLSPKADNGLSHTFVYHYLCSSAKNIRDMAKYSINLGSISKDSIMGFEIPCPPLPIQEEVLAILNEMEAQLKVMEQMAEKAEQRAKYILDGYLTS